MPLRLCVLALLISIDVSAKNRDFIYLLNGAKIKCTVIDIIPNRVFYTTRKNTTDSLDSEVVNFILIDEKNVEVRELIDSSFTFTGPTENCQIGTDDAIMFHNRGFGNFCLGFFFGVVGIAGTALGKPHPPDYTNSKSKEVLISPEYLYCYNKKAKAKNVVNAACGFASYLALFLIVISSN